MTTAKRVISNQAMTCASRRRACRLMVGRRISWCKLGTPASSPYCPNRRKRVRIVDLPHLKNRSCPKQSNDDEIQ